MKKAKTLLETLTCDALTKNSANQYSKIQRLVKEAHYSIVSTEPLSSPVLVSSSKKCQDEYGIKEININLCAGNEESSTDYWSLAYGGHQFGSYAGQLGDGRAISLFQFQYNPPNSSNVSGLRMAEIQLKGAGLTPYSRFADGFAVLRSSIREYLASEAMYHLNIPTSRCLTLISGDRKVQRETLEQGAVVSRIAENWIRFGNFELFFYRQDEGNLKILADYVIDNFYADSINSQAKYTSFFTQVCEKTAYMIAKWMAVGFCHGVMNTDNFSIMGLTIDYGPYQFLDEFDRGYICNKSDETGLYSFENQPIAAKFNLHKLATALVPLVLEETNKDKPRTIELLSTPLDGFLDRVQTMYMAEMQAKLGISKEHPDFVKGLLDLLEKYSIDYTLFFRDLCSFGIHSESKFERCGPLDDEIITYLKKKYLPILIEECTEKYKVDELTDALIKESDEIRMRAMKGVNPLYLPRNHLLQLCIEGAENGEYELVNEYLDVLANPFEDGNTQQQEKWGKRVPEKMKGLKCSCSS